MTAAIGRRGCALVWLLGAAIFAGSLPAAAAPRPPETAGGWQKSAENPVLGGRLGTCFDVCVLPVEDGYRMYFSWRPKKSVALVCSPDGVHWERPRIVLSPNGSPWQERINRPVVLRHQGRWHLWYTGQSPDRSAIGYATSDDGLEFRPQGDGPVLRPEQPWEKVAVMCPHVLWDAGQRQFRMWYSAGEQYEPNAIGYATSPDGSAWTKWPANPIFKPDAGRPWQRHKVTACQVIRRGDWHLMFYIGFADEHTAAIGLARSRDGVTGWQPHPANPILAPGRETWDGEACYKPSAAFDARGNRWLLWYNGRRGSLEQIGLAVHPGEDLGFAEEASRDAPPP